MSKYHVGDTSYTFEVLQEYQLNSPNKDFAHFAKCKENGRYAWLDGEGGFQFEGEPRIIADSISYGHVVVPIKTI